MLQTNFPIPGIQKHSVNRHVRSTWLSRKDALFLTATAIGGNTIVNNPSGYLLSFGVKFEVSEEDICWYIWVIKNSRSQAQAIDNYPPQEPIKTKHLNTNQIQAFTFIIHGLNQLKIHQF